METDAGFRGLLIPVRKSGRRVQPFDLTAFFGDWCDQNTPNTPEYPAGSAGYITLGAEGISPMSSDVLLQYGEYVYAAGVVALLVYVLRRISRRKKSNQPRMPHEVEVIAQESTAPSDASQATNGSESPNQAPWWNQEDFPYSAPWWLRYPASIGVFAGAYWAFFEWDKKAGWIFGVLLVIIGLGLVRELFLGILIAALAGLALWAVGAAVAALPVSVAIIIGAMIIAQAIRR